MIELLNIAGTGFSVCLQHFSGRKTLLPQLDVLEYHFRSAVD